MRFRLRQIVMVAADLESVEEQIVDRLGVELCYRDPGVGAFGLRNALFPIGDKFLEVVSPIRRDTTAGRFLAKRGGDGGYMVMFETDDLVGMRTQFADADARVVFEATEEGITGLHLHPVDVGGAIVSVDQAAIWGTWPWAGPSWRDHIRLDRVTDVVGVEIEARDPVAMAARWSEVLGRPAAGGRIIADEGVVSFTPASGRGEGIAGFTLRAARGADPVDTTICGCRFRSVR